MVMIADDEEALRRLVLTILGGHGFRILEAANGVDAMALAREKHPHVLLLDVAMPEIDGISVCTALKSDPNTAGIKVAMVTAMANEADRELGFAAGADRYIAKPFSPRQLIAEVHQFLR